MKLSKERFYILSFVEKSENQRAGGVLDLKGITRIDWSKLCNTKSLVNG